MSSVLFDFDEILLIVRPFLLTLELSLFVLPFFLHSCCDFILQSLGLLASIRGVSPGFEHILVKWATGDRTSRY